MPLFALDEPLAPGDVATAPLRVGATTYSRAVVRTEWVQPGADLAAVVGEATEGLRDEADVIAISEKLVLVATGRGVPVSGVRPGRLARWAAARIRPIGRSRGLGIPEKMQLVIDLTGRTRIVLALAAAALTRPLRVRGAFFLVAGENARSMDGMRTPYDDVLLPPLRREEAAEETRRLSRHLGCPVAIVDINDRGGTVRSVDRTSPLARREVAAALRDNPMGQRARATPIVVITRRPDQPEGA